MISWIKSLFQPRWAVVHALGTPQKYMVYRSFEIIYTSNFKHIAMIRKDMYDRYISDKFPNFRHEQHIIVMRYKEYAQKKMQFDLERAG